MNDIVIVPAARTTISNFGGALQGISATDLGIPTARADIDRMAASDAALRKEDTVTAGQMSGINHVAASLIVMEAGQAARRGLSALTRMRSSAQAGVDPRLMGIGPVPAILLSLDRAGITAADLAVIECTEACAAQACAVTAGLGLDPATRNPDGGAVAQGHLIGASPTTFATRMVDELRRSIGRLGVATKSIGGGHGTALIVETA